MWKCHVPFARWQDLTGLAMKVSLVVYTLLTTVLSIRYLAPEDCSWKNVDPSSDDVALKCNLRTINGLFDNTNFSLIQPDHTAQLIISCEDVLFDSSLGNHSFEHLKELKTLLIYKCKLQEISPLVLSGLHHLVNLTINTYNRDWDDSRVLIIHPGALSHLEKLEQLDLSHNNIFSLPPSIFCNLNRLIFLNLSYNGFTDVHSLSLKDLGQCQLRIGELDLSYNSIKVLTNQGFTSLQQLTILNLQNNHISRAEESALEGLKNLEILYLSSNQLVAVPPQVLQQCERLVELYLQNNSISVIPPGLFSGLQHLTVLDLSINELGSHWLGPDTFVDLIRLVKLDISHNKMTYVDASTFRSLYSLQVLELHHNQISSIGDNAFASLYNLHTLMLSHNRLTHIDIFTLSGLHVLNVLYLDHNSIESVHEEAFRNGTNLMEINLGKNHLRSVPSAVHSLQFLRSLDISSNNITNIRNSSYRGLQHLYNLILQNNRIGNLSKGFFSDLPSLRILNLADNMIHTVEQGTFDDVPELHALRLDSNYVTDINGLFSNLHDLLMLNVSANRITWFDYALVPIGLQWLDIHQNLIEALGNYFELENVLKLRTLDSSFNRILEIDSSSLPNGIEIVYLNNNHIRTIHAFTFMGKPNLTRVDLTRNHLQTLEVNAFRLTEVRSRKPLPEFSISGNPYMCDCSMEWLQRIGSLDGSRQYPRMVDLEEIVCQLSFTRRKVVTSLVKTHSSQFLCRYKSHCFALCHCCEFDACDCEMVCPEHCTCYYDQSWNTNIVDCSSRGHTSVPRRIPMDVTELYLDGNDIPSLSSHTFIGRKNMRVLFLNHSNVHIINNRTFNGLKSLQMLYLQNNKLVMLHGFEFERLVNLRELHLSYNHLTAVSNNTFASLKSLQILYLDHNFLAEFQVWQLRLNRQLRDIRLSHNPWLCRCDFVEDFSNWLQYTEQEIADLEELQCFYNDTASVALVEFNTTTCTNYTATSYVQTLQSQDFMPIVVVIASIFALLLFVVIVACAYRRRVSRWMYTRYGLRLFRQRDQEEKLFDAFLSYSKKDEVFVSEILASELENGEPPYRLCLHYRDLPSGGYLADAVFEAIESSRRIIVLLSENFLRTEWSRYDPKSTQHNMLRTCRNKLILIFCGVSPRDVDAELKDCCKSGTLLHWGEKRFWEKLRYAMPDVSGRKGERSRPDGPIAVHI
ncbi:toll-like receptor 6 [Centruroides sculpturatus]|uniref:toll-like receptor 6 n=1 Tax=Centruroides sculpturatus TaxID=218467 RepID=UPI000C6E07A2|nr:toll-like receptor 6 [Centruroides sculpturatus]